ncbi:LptA/OstA family protein [Halonatronum saccharophilum]|uniref:LptA/OstA family protein n=1 Tax=Halonatronum saccharophilum TaxID=150060 RepID=UPI00048A42BB|nr:LptA/OstA family protein [Halonatronum saccharophilum]
MKNRVIMTLLIITLCSINLLAQEGIKEEPSERERAKLSSQRLRYIKEENIYIATQNVLLDYEGNQISSDKLRLERNNDKAYFSGGVKLVREVGDIIDSQDLELDLKEDTLIAQDDVSLEAQRRGEALDLTSNYLKVWTKSNDMLAKEDVFLFHSGKEIYGDRLDYFDQLEEIRVKGNTKLDDDGELIKADELNIYLESESLNALGNVLLTRRDGDIISSNTLNIDGEEDELLAQEDVRLEAQRSGKPLELSSNYLKILTDSNDMMAKDNLFLLYDEKEVYGDRLDYFDQKEKMKVTGSARIDDDGEIIEAEELLIYLESGSLDAKDDVVLTRRDGDLIESNRLAIDAEEDILVAQKDVSLESQRRGRSLELSSNHLKIWTDSNDMLAKEDVFLLYDQKEVYGDRLDYFDEQEEMKVSGNAKLDDDGEVIKADELMIYLESGSLDAKDNVILTRRDGDLIEGNRLAVDADEDTLIAQEDVRLESNRGGKALELTSNYLKIWTDSNDMLAKDDVFVIYDNQEIRGDKLEYDDNKEEMVVTGSAEIKEDGQWMRSRRIVINLEDGSIDAQGQVEMEFDI